MYLSRKSTVSSQSGASHATAARRPSWQMENPLAGGSAVFVDAETMKEKIRRASMKEAYDVSNFYHPTGIWQAIAKHPLFESVTFVVIAVNALWIAIDTDLNEADMLFEAKPIFQIAEHGFCAFFAFEWVVRFNAFEHKRHALRDRWFVFDSILIFIMVSETWVMNIVLFSAGVSGGSGLGNASVMRMARMLRLMRMARVARLCKAMPELLILVKAMVASIRSCFFVFLLLAMMMYIFGIVFRQLTAGTPAGEAHFTSVLRSMHTLWLDGTLLDNTSQIVDALWEEGIALVLIFYVFVLLSALTLMNMLVGVLVEVVSAVAATEREGLTVNFVKAKLLELIEHSGCDENQDGVISKEEFKRLLDYPQACQAFMDIGVDVFSLIDNIDYIFSDDPDSFAEDKAKPLTFEQFMELVLELRGSNNATVKDMIELRKFLARSHRAVTGEVRSNARMLRETARLRRRPTRLTSDGSAASCLSTKVLTFTPDTSVDKDKDRSGWQVPHTVVDTAPSELEDSKVCASSDLCPKDIDFITSLRNESNCSELINRLKTEFKASIQEALLPELSTLKKLLEDDSTGEKMADACGDNALRLSAWRSELSDNERNAEGLKDSDLLLSQRSDAIMDIVANSNVAVPASTLPKQLPQRPPKAKLKYTVSNFSEA